jgi:hypothetical protein
MFRRACGSLVLLIFCTSPLFAQGTLQRTRETTHEDTGQPAAPPAPTPPSKSSDASTFTDSAYSGLSAGSAEGVGALGLLSCVVATSPIWGPYTLLEDDLRVRGYFPHYPYALDYSGFLHIDSNGSDPPSTQEARFGDPNYLKFWSIRLSAENGNDFRGLYRVNGTLVIDTTSRFGLQTSWNYFHECLDGGGSDETVLGTSNLTFRFAQKEWVQMHAGMGFRLLNDRTETRAGFNFLYGADFFPVKPLVLSASVNLGNLDSAFVVQARGTAGIALKRCEPFVGYEFLRIGSVNLQGLVAGVRFWL